MSDGDNNVAVTNGATIYAWLPNAVETSGASYVVPMETVSESDVSSGAANIRFFPTKYVGKINVWIGDSFVSGFATNTNLFTVTNKGVGGNTLTQIQARFATDVIALAPDGVLIEGGLNDISTASSDNNATMRANIVLMADAAIAAGITPIFTTIPPWGNAPTYTSTRQAYGDSYNAWLASYCASNGYTLFDMNALLADPSNPVNILPAYLSVDNVHPSALGYQVIVKAITTLLDPLFAPVSTTLTTMIGALTEPSRTNIALWTRDHTNAAWVKTTMTAAKTATGIDGVANSASTLTATGANSTSLQTVTLASSDRVFAPFIKRRTGTGVVEITTNNGATWTAVTGLINSSTYTRVSTAVAAVTNPVFGVRLVTSGDAIDIDFSQNETGTNYSSPIPTTTAAVTRAASTGTIPSSGNITAAAGTFNIEWTPASIITGDNMIIMSLVDASNYTALIYNSTGTFIMRKRIAAVNYDASLTLTAVVGTTYKVAGDWGASGVLLAVNGTAGTPHANTTNAQIGATVSISAYTQESANKKNLRPWTTQLSQATLNAMTR